VIGGVEYREVLKRENKQITEASSPLRGQSSNSDVSEVSKTTDYVFGNEVTAGFPLVRT
jgi:hypothetical protein